MKFVVDENLPPALAKALHALFGGEHDIIHIRDRVGPSTTDLEWIPLLGREGGWIVISGDRRIRKNQAEYLAFKQQRLIGFFLCRTVYEMDARRQMIRLLTVWPDMVVQAGLVQPGAMFEIPQTSNKFRAL